MYRNRPYPGRNRAGYSERSAETGSTRVARRAGIQHAASPAEEQQRGDAGEGAGVETADLEQQAREVARREKRPGQAEQEPGADQREPLREHHAQDVGRRGAEREADADLARPAAHAVGDHSVDSEHREQQGRRAEEPQQRRAEARLRDRVVDELASWGRRTRSAGPDRAP